ncbi:MAG: cbb3-type cytochrome c oxidase subunit 3 [Proteobacteria bacterium]|nr:cbb3-type cytochrome c oxidase subunit 3 [Pseudomonadota bacterium]
MIGVVRGLITLSLLLLFMAYVIWAYSKQRKSTFDALARVPLEEDSNPVSRTQ